MTTSIPLPDLGDGVTEATVTQWFKQLGDTVAVGEPLFEVSTDKVDVEVTSPVEGAIAQILVTVGTMVRVGEPVAVVEEVGPGIEGANGRPAGADVPAEASSGPMSQASPPAVGGETAAHFDVLVLGAGPGGYVAAIRAAQLGKSVAVVEEKYWGGVCLNVGCIPSKALLKNAELAHVLTHKKELFGIEGDAQMAYHHAHRRSRQVSADITSGVHFLLRKNRVTEIEGWGTLVGPKTVLVKSRDGRTSTFQCDDLIIATGAEVWMPRGIEKSTNVVSYEEQILDAELPSSLIIGGAGAIGVELAYVMHNFGVDVTIVEFMDRMVPTEDADVSRELLKRYRELGVKVLLSTKVDDVTDHGSGVEVKVSRIDGGSTVLAADRMLAAFGFVPRIRGYGLEQAGVALTQRGAIEVDGFCRTSVDGVYAIGDVTGKSMLAHTAEAMGIVAAEVIAGRDPVQIDFDMIPRATYCQPQIASFGFTREQAEERGHVVKTSTFPFSANGKARGLGEASGFVKLVADAEQNRILGAHMIGPDVTEQLPLLTLAQRAGLDAPFVARNVFAHPTLSEAVKEALHGIAGHMINL